MATRAPPVASLQAMLRGVARPVIRAGLGVATRQPWLRRAIGKAIAPFPRLRLALVRAGSGPVLLTVGRGAAADPALTPADRQAMVGIGAASAVVFRQLRAAIATHDG